MTVDKFSVSMPQELVQEVDELAAKEGLTRSGVLREAAARYVASREAEARQAERAERIDEALAAFEEISTEWGADDLPGVDYLREVRGDRSRHAVGLGPGGTD